MIVNIKGKLRRRMCLLDDAEECVKGYCEVHHCYHSTSIKN